MPEHFMDISMLEHVLLLPVEWYLTYMYKRNTLKYTAEYWLIKTFLMYVHGRLGEYYVSQKYPRKP